MRHETILVTGGAGFVGSHIAIWLKRRLPGVRVIALDNLKRRGSEMNTVRLEEHGIRFLHGDIRNTEDLELYTDLHAIVECSAEPSVAAGYGKGARYLVQTNLVGTIHCLELARRHKADVVFVSTSRVYPYGLLNSLLSEEGDSRFRWIEHPHTRVAGWSKQGVTEGFPLDGPRSLYGATKLCSEFILREYMDMYGIRMVVNRCGVIAGPWQFGKTDQGVFGFWMLAHYFKTPLRYIGFGGTGKQVRDVVHVDDVCQLIELQLSSMDRTSGGTFNVGGGLAGSLSLKETTVLCQEMTGNAVAIDPEPTNRPGDVRIYYSDNSAVRTAYGWSPGKNPSDVMRDIFDWIRSNERDLKRLMSGWTTSM